MIDVLADRLAAKTIVDDSGCWLWIGAKDLRGYGSAYWDGHYDKTHRLSWRVANGPIPEGMFVLHHCDVPSCINPDHLFLGTQLDNIRDAVSKGRHRHAVLPGELNPNAKLTEREVIMIRRLASRGEKQKALAKRFGVSQPMIGLIVRRRAWRNI